MTDLQPAIVAAQNGLWAKVIDYLQSGSIELGNLAWDERQTAETEILDLALQVLFDADFEEQWEIAKLIPKLGEIAVEPLLNRLNDPDIDSEDRWFVARILGEFDRPQVVTALVETVKLNEDPDLVAMATSALAKIGTTAIAALANLLQTSPEQRLLAVTALAQIRHSQTIEPLLSVASDPDGQIRTIAIEALSSFHDDRIPPLLLTKLTDLAPSVRQAAIGGLCRRPELAIELDLAQHLRPLLFDLNLAVCEATVLGLARLPDPRVVEILTRIANSAQTPQTLRSQAILALGWIGTTAAISSLAQLLPTASTDVAVEIILALSKTEQERVFASQLLVEYLHSHSQHLPIIVQEIATALGHLGNIDCVSDLVQLLANPDERVKLHAISAITKLRSATTLTFDN